MPIVLTDSLRPVEARRAGIPSFCSDAGMSVRVLDSGGVQENFGPAVDALVELVVGFGGVVERQFM